MAQVANAVTSLRLVLLPVALYFFMKNDIRSNVISLVLVIFMELSDLFDGMIARKFNSISNLGKIFDPFADHIYRISFFLFFSIKGFIPLWMFLICFYRDSIVMNLRIFAAKQEDTFVAARRSGKIKAEVQSVAIILFIFLQIVNYKYRIVNLDKLYFLIMFIVAAVTLWSAIDYLLGILRRGRRYLNRSCVLFSILFLIIIMVHGDYHRVIFQPSNAFSWKEQSNLKKILPEYSPLAISGDGSRLFLTFQKSNAPTILAIIDSASQTILKRIEIPNVYGKLTDMDYYAKRLWMINGEDGRLITVDIAQSLASGSFVVLDEIETGIEGVNGLVFVQVDERPFLALSVYLKEGRTYLADYSRMQKGNGVRESIRSEIKNYNFSQGLAFDGVYLYDANSYFGFDRIFKVDLRRVLVNESYNDSVVEVFNSPDQMIKGIFIRGNDIWTLDEFTLKLYKGILRK
jgi:CDP-diacylglycerol---glycerol-3-phosphate 3-phosphatidyltransferase